LVQKIDNKKNEMIKQKQQINNIDKIKNVNVSLKKSEVSRNWLKLSWSWDLKNNTKNIHTLSRNDDGIPIRNRQQ